MLASSHRELTAMNEVATDYARKNRFQFNGDKSAVMIFNAHRLLGRLQLRRTGP